MPHDPHECIDTAELARRLGVTPSTALAWARRGLIPAIRISRKVRRYVWREVVRALQLHGRGPGADGDLR